MISDISGRYVVAATETELVRYDRRWRRMHRSTPFDGDPFTYVEGVDHILCARSQQGGEVIEALVVSVRNPSKVLAKGVYEEKWKFSGDHQAWQYVPDYLLVPAENVKRKVLIRIDDDAVVDTLEEIEDMHAVTPIPGSRLVVLAGSGQLNVYDPIARSYGAHVSIKGGIQTPSLRLSDMGEVLWMNDVDSLLKIDARKWEALDAAGLEGTGNTIASWAMSPNEAWIGVVHEDSNEVLLLSTETFLPVWEYVFYDAVSSVCVFDDGNMLGFRAEPGVFARPRARVSISQ